MLIILLFYTNNDLSTKTDDVFTQMLLLKIWKVFIHLLESIQFEKL